MFNEAFNHGKAFKFDSSNLPYSNLNEVVAENGNKQLEVKGVFINPKSEFGPTCYIVTPSLIVRLPNHFIPDVEKILSRPDMIEAIDNGHCAFIPEQYTDKKGKTRNSGKFIDVWSIMKT